MAGSYNKISIIGNLGRDPEMRYVPSGDAVTSFSVAVSERYKARDGQPQERTNWFNVSCFGTLANVANDYLHKGSSVYIEGSLQQRSTPTAMGWRAPAWMCGRANSSCSIAVATTREQRPTRGRATITRPPVAGNLSGHGPHAALSPHATTAWSPSER